MSGTPLFSICHTTARPDGWQESYQQWMRNAADPRRVQYILTPDARTGLTEAPLLRPHRDMLAFSRGRRCNVDGYNLAASIATGQILIMGADDFFPEVGWDEKILAAVPDLDADFVLRPSWGKLYDAWLASIGHPGLLVGHILSRARYERFGYMSYPEFESMGCDIDFTEQAEFDGVVIDCRETVTIEHRHPIAHASRQWDPVYLAENLKDRHERGNRILARRRAERGGVGPVAVPNRKNIVVFRPGDMFPWEVEAEWSNLLVHLVARFNVRLQFESCSNQYFVRDFMLRKARTGLAAEKITPDYVLWLDSDNKLTAEGFELLLDALTYVPEIAGVGGWYWIDSQPPQICARVRDGGAVRSITIDEMQAAYDEVRLLEATDHMGFGAMLMRWSVLEAAGEWPFCPIVQFDDGEESPYKGDDVSFCRRAIAQGHKFFVHPEVYLPHLKRKDVPAPALKPRKEDARPSLANAAD